MRQKSAGFTLIEVMVAMAITAVVAVVSYGTINVVIRLHRHHRGNGHSHHDFNQRKACTFLPHGDSSPALGVSVLGTSAVGLRMACFVLRCIIAVKVIKGESSLTLSLAYQTATSTP